MLSPLPCSGGGEETRVRENPHLCLDEKEAITLAKHQVPKKGEKKADGYRYGLNVNGARLQYHLLTTDEAVGNVVAGD